MAMEQLLELLQGEAKLTPAQLAVMLGEREEDVVKAIQRYEKEGVIKGYHALINWERIVSGAGAAENTDFEFGHGLASFAKEEKRHFSECHGNLG